MFIYARSFAYMTVSLIILIWGTVMMMLAWHWVHSAKAEPMSESAVRMFFALIATIGFDVEKGQVMNELFPNCAVLHDYVGIAVALALYVYVVHLLFVRLKHLVHYAHLYWKRGSQSSSHRSTHRRTHPARYRASAT